MNKNNQHKLLFICVLYYTLNRSGEIHGKKIDSFEIDQHDITHNGRGVVIHSPTPRGPSRTP